MFWFYLASAALVYWAGFETGRLFGKADGIKWCMEQDALYERKKDEGDERF